MSPHKYSLRMVHGRSRWQPKRSSINIPVKLPLAGAATSTIFVVTSACLSWQIFVTSNTCLSRQSFCRNKHTFVATKDVFFRNKHVFIATKVSLSPQNYVCRDKSFGVTQICLSRQTYLCILSRQTYLCRDKRLALSRQKFRRDKNNTYGRSRQWYQAVCWSFDNAFTSGEKNLTSET